MTRLNRRHSVIAVMLIVVLMMSTVSVNAASTKVWVSKIKAPTTLKQGKTFSVKGYVKSNKKIKKVEIGIVDSANRWTPYKYSKKTSTKKFNIKKADKKLKFGKLAVGKYNYRIYAHTSDKKVTCVYDQPFYIVGTTTASTSTPVNYAPAEGVAIASQAAEVQLSNANFPGDYYVGRPFNVRGVISSDELITRVEAGIVVTATNKWSDYKYDAPVLSKSFDLSRAASSLRFDKLPGGQFTYRVYAHTTSGVKIVVNKSFRVTPSDKPQKAVNWAVAIANDDSFSYGKRPATNKNGCYFCGTNQKKKPKGYEKTYVCSTFVHAAYAHGAGDPELLRDCQSGKYCLSLTDSNMKNYSCWMKIGLAKDLKPEDLLPGDVICAYAPSNFGGHLAIYAGNNKIVHASGDGFGANTITVKNNYAQKMLDYAKNHHSKSYVMRYTK